MYYAELPSLKYVRLEDSYVLRIVEQPSFLFEMNFALVEGHDPFLVRNDGHPWFYRRGRLEFLGVENVHWVCRTDERSVDADGLVDFGCIDYMDVASDGFFDVEGGWGNVKIRCKELRVSYD